MARSLNIQLCVIFKLRWQTKYLINQLETPKGVKNNSDPKKATDSQFYMSDGEAEKILHVYKTHNPNFAYYKVEGGHHLHLNTPEKVAPLVTKFLLQDFTAEGDKIKEVPFDMI